MKKIILLFAIIGMIAMQSCTVNETSRQPDNDTISEVFEVTRDFSTANSFSTLVSFRTSIYSSDMVLVYHLYDVVNGTDVWRLMPQTYYFTNGDELDYNFDFTRNDVNIFLDANFPLTTLSSAWTQNQTFRVVIIPGFFSNKVSSQVDFLDYNAVIKTLKIKEAAIKKIR
jgi:hypothetical protein